MLLNFKEFDNEINILLKTPKEVWYASLLLERNFDCNTVFDNYMEECTGSIFEGSIRQTLVGDNVLVTITSNKFHLGYVRNWIKQPNLLKQALIKTGWELTENGLV